MTPQQMDPLAQLRDIHLPAAVSNWPPAPGWWILLVILLAASGFCLYLWLQHRRHHRYRKLALQQLQHLDVQLQSGSGYLPALNQLLKRTVLAAPQPAPVAQLAGEKWLAFLDRSGGTNAFTTGPGQLLRDGPYAPTTFEHPDQQQLQQLHTLAKTWIQKHRLEGGNPPC